MARGITFIAVLVLLTVAYPASAVVVQWSGFESFTNYGLGDVGENLRNAGYGPPTGYASEGAIKTTGTTSQRYTVPGYPAVDPDGDGWLFPNHASNGANPFSKTNFAQFVQDLGGPAPASGAVRITADIRIDITGTATAADYDAAKIQPVFGGIEWLGGSGSSAFSVFDPKTNGNHQFGQWYNDFELLSLTDFPSKMILILANTFDVNNPTLGAGDGLNFYWDDLKIEYVPEPTAALLLLAPIALLRVRRKA